MESLLSIHTRNDKNAEQKNADMPNQGLLGRQAKFPPIWAWSTIPPDSPFWHDKIWQIHLHLKSEIFEVNTACNF